MEDVLFWTLVALAALSTLFILPSAAFTLFRLATAAMAGMREAFSSGLRDIGEDREFLRLRRDMQERIRKHMSRRFRRGFRGQREDMELYAATVLLKETLSACCELHHFTADVRGAAHMRELETHLICNAHRTRVLDTLEFVMDSVASQDLSAKPNAKMAIGVEAMHDICSDCMLLKFKRDEAPRLCDPAKFMGCEPEGD